MSTAEDWEGETLLSRLLSHRDRDPDQVFATFLGPEGEVTLSWRGLFARAAAIAEALEQRGVEEGEIVFVLAPLGPDVLAAFLGIMMTPGLSALLSYPSSKVAPEVYSRNLCNVLEVTAARTVFTSSALGGPLSEALERIEDAALLWLEEVEEPSEELRSAWESRVREISPDSVAFLQHSSGSTGLQKGVALTHAAVLRHTRHYGEAIALDPSRDRIASWLPLYHDMGLIATFLLPLVAGLPVFYLDPFRWVVDPCLLLEAISRHRATLTWLPNFAYIHMAKRIPARRLEGLDLSSMRGFVNCSEPVRAESHELFVERFAPLGVRAEACWVCYAMAENTFAVTSSAEESRVDRIDPVRFATERAAIPAAGGLPVVSCGRPIQGCEVLVVDEDRRPLAERRIGEIAIRSDTLLEEYHGNPEATAAAIAEGWYYSGDLGYLAEGELYVTGRKKDLIIVGGRNFYPQDLEHVASGVAGVIPGRVAALGQVGRSGTEEVVIVAETQVEDAAKADLQREIQREALERLDCAVSRVQLVEPGWIVKTSSGKVARRANLEKLQALDASAPAPAAPAPARQSVERPMVRPAPAELSLGLWLLQVAFALAIIVFALILRPNEAVVLYRGF